jgi:hypothetical protein
LQAATAYGVRRLVAALVFNSQGSVCAKGSGVSNFNFARQPLRLVGLSTELTVRNNFSSLPAKLKFETPDPSTLKVKENQSDAEPSHSILACGRN